MNMIIFYSRYVGDDDDRNEITDDLDSTRKITSKDDLGDYVSQQISWTPTRDELCQYESLVSLFTEMYTDMAFYKELRLCFFRRIIAMTLK